LDLYPDRDVLALRRALARQLGVGLEHIEVGNGTAELIWSIALAFLRPADAVLIIGPTFDEYGRAAALMGAVVHKLDACPEQGFAVDVDAVSRCLAEVGVRVVFICNPNNPNRRLYAAGGHCNLGRGPSRNALRGR
jgi:threonine-phosphate decarboxylase